MLNEFKKFILKGNVVDLSTGVIIGAAFGNIVTAFTKGIVEPLIKLASGGTDPNVTLKLWIFDVGVVINALIGFLITATVIFFVIVKPVNKLLSMMKKEEAAAPPPPTPADIALLTEIRDLLKK
ncbi:MAG TPA: large conductance mechanosensitive channel protein MscL [Verrucomicrobiales bacterium]|nr:large conductance mechanosensitive channel protein MscL [Verrucomicrobiales bacterium]HCN76421.1 large conductance mechanosensitive channel protein MscL [Verrucomicrobiales bacterium]HRJ09406.1 large conductance mechanosensitive channel protein MscL [Prosthecobacter sp.]HRK15623.1 large conductance mechanosensitive channel protein MscL [Prosthecobacter sp.]